MHVNMQHKATSRVHLEYEFEVVVVNQHINSKKPPYYTFQKALLHDLT